MTHNAVRTDVGAEGPGNWVDQQGRQDGAAAVYMLDAPVWVSAMVAAPFGATSGALDANDAMGDPFTFNAALSGESLPKHGRILSIKMVDRSDVVLAATIHIFNKAFTAAASDAAFTISVLDAAAWVASELFDAGTDIGSAKVHVIKNVNTEYYAPDGRLYAQLSTSGTPTPTINAMPTIQLIILPLE